jgi:two-component system sensor histidine kinase CpxA
MMRPVFAKILIWFAFSLALVGFATYVAISATTPPLQERLKRFNDPALTGYARTATVIVSRESPAALAAYFEKLERRTRINAFLVDDTGREVSGRPVPAEAVTLAARARATPDTVPEAEGSVLFKARPVTGPDGREYVLIASTPVGFLRLLHDAPSAQLVRLFAVLATAGAVCYGLARHVAAPLATLREATREVAAGNLTVRVGPALAGRRDEFGDLGRDFDRMAARIEALMASERRLLRDISHELRSPLARLGVGLGLARQRYGDDDTILSRIEREAERLNALIGQVLVLARLESGSEEQPREVVDLTRIVHEVAADADFEAHGRQRSVKVTHSDDCLVVGAPDLLRSAVENVVRNAVRHTREGTTVEIAVDPAGVVSIRDHGPGVPESALADIFRPFYRVGDGRERENGGVGLGLSIAQRTIGFHGGTVRAANACDGGLLVRISLPTLR